MKQVTIQEPSRARRDRIRELGFDPSQLTPREQEELLDLYNCLEGRDFVRREAPARR